MKNKVGLKKLTAAVLALIFLMLPLTACKGGGSGKEKVPDFVYVPKYTTVSEEIPDMNTPYLSGDVIYFTSSIPVHKDGTPLTDEEEKAIKNELSRSMVLKASGTDISEVEGTGPAVDYSNIKYIPAVFAINKDGTNFHKLEDYSPKETVQNDYGYINIEKLIVDPQGNIWVCESISRTLFDLPEGFDPKTQDPYQYYAGDERKTYIRKLSNTGAETSAINLDQIVDKPSEEEVQQGAGNFYLGDMVADKSGNLYFTDGNKTLYVVDTNGNLLAKLSVENYLNRIIVLKDGTVGVTTDSGDGSSVIRSVNLSSKSWGQDFKMPMNAWNTSSGGKQYDFCYSDSTSLFGYNVATQANEKILSWINCDVDGDNIRFSTVLDNGDVFAISYEYGNEGGRTVSIIDFVKTPGSEVKQKKTLTLATMWLDYNLKKQILKFNKTNEDYRIEVQDYAEFNTEKDYNAGITKLNTEIISGNIPDMIEISQLPYQQYAAKGLLEDLYPYIDKDPDLDRKDLVPSIFKAIEMDGKLYQISTSFAVLSLIGKPSVVGNEMGWTMEEMQKVVSEHPEADYPLGSYMTRENVLDIICSLNLENYIDWQSGKCSFNTDEFKNLLTFAKSFPEKMPDNQGEEQTDPGTLIQDGRQLFENFYLSDFQSYQYYKAMFGGAITFKGFPSADKKGNIAVLSGGLAMSSSCKDKDGAWKFMRTLLDADYQKDNVWSFPTNQKAFDAKLAEAMKQEYTTDENGKKIPVSHGGMSIGNGPTVEFYAITQEEADQIKTVINSVAHTAAYDQKVLDIIKEEAGYFFSGEKTVDQTADVIQNRISLYINEQR